METKRLKVQCRCKIKHEYLNDHVWSEVIALNFIYKVEGKFFKIRNKKHLFLNDCPFTGNKADISRPTARILLAREGANQPMFNDYIKKFAEGVFKSTDYYVTLPTSGQTSSSVLAKLSKSKVNRQPIALNFEVEVGE